MKKYIKIPALCMLIYSVMSCSQFLETSPKGLLYPDTYYTTEANLESALAGVYSTLGSSRVYGNGYVQDMANDADETYWNRSTYTYGPRIFDYSPADPSITFLWQTLYDGIGRANMLLYKLPAADVSDGVKKRIEGEALFLRAYFYFLLVQNFGRVPLELEPKFTPDNLDTPQSDIAAVYEVITTDMERVLTEDLVMSIDKIGYGGRVTKSAVRGILARVYLTMAGYPLNDGTKYEDARRCLLAIIEDSEFTHELNSDYSQIFINYAADKYDTKESIWEVEFWGNRGDVYTETGTIGGINGIGNSIDESIGLAGGQLKATGVIFKLYEEGDLRRDRSIAPFTYYSIDDPANPGNSIAAKSPCDPANSWQRFIGKYRREEETLKPKVAHQTPINFPLLRFSDVLLMYAEVENEINLGPTPEAYDAINQVRRRAFGKLLPGAVNISEYDLSGLDYDTFTQTLRDERSRELCFESLRRFDLIRWGFFVPRMNSIVEIIESDMSSISGAGNRPPDYSVRGFRNVSAKHLLHPIPSKEMSLNRNLKQNHGW